MHIGLSAFMVHDLGALFPVREGLCRGREVCKRQKRVTLRVVFDCHVEQELSRAALPLLLIPAVNSTCSGNFSVFLQAPR